MSSSGPRRSSVRPVSTSTTARPPSPPLVRPIPIRPFAPPTAARPTSPATPARPRSRTTASPVRPVSYSAVRPASTTETRPLSRAYRIPPPPGTRAAREFSPPHRLPELPAHLSFLDPDRDYPRLDPLKYPDGTRLRDTNLVVVRGTPRLATAYWARWVFETLANALQDHLRIQDEYYSKLTGERSILMLRPTVERDCRVLVNACLGALRFLLAADDVTKAVPVAALSYLHIPWGDTGFWNRLNTIHGPRIVHRAKETRQSVLALRDLISCALRHWDELSHSISTNLGLAYRYTRALYDAWHVEATTAVSRNLRKRAQGRVDREAWYMLQRRAQAATDGCVQGRAAQDKLIRHLTRASGIAADSYMDHYDDLLAVVPSTHSTSPAFRPKPNLVRHSPSARRRLASSPNRTYPRGILRDPSPEGAFDGRVRRSGSVGTLRPAARPYSPVSTKASSVERYGRTG
ncbi:hypothetical protein JCM10212_005027 [Sporobolomyces blumeae]